MYWPHQDFWLSNAQLTLATKILLRMALEKDNQHSIFSVLPVDKVSKYFYWNRVVIMMKTAVSCYMEEWDTGDIGEYYRVFKPYYTHQLLTYNTHTLRRYHMFFVQQLVYEARTHIDFLRWTRVYLERYTRCWPLSVSGMTRRGADRPKRPYYTEELAVQEKASYLGRRVRRRKN
jgi:hypothetical protein